MAARHPRVGVGLPVHNGERYLEETLKSLMSQTYEDWRLIVADNASTDRTREIVGDFAARDRRIEYVRRERNIGAIANFNEVFRQVGTEYFRWHSADDISLPEYTERCVEILDNDPSVALAYCKTTDIDATGIEIGTYEDRAHAPHDRPRDRFLHLLTYLWRCNANYGLMRSSMAGQTRLLQPFLGSDQCFMAELALYGKFIEVPERLFQRRYHINASSAMTDDERWEHNSGQRARPTLRLIRRWWACSSATIRAPLPTGEILRMQLDVMRYAWWDLDSMMRGLAGAARRRLAGHRQG